MSLATLLAAANFLEANNNTGATDLTRGTDTASLIKNKLIIKSNFFNVSL